MAKPYLLQQLENNDNKDIFYAIYDETTYEEILEAYQADKIIMAKMPHQEEDNYMEDYIFSLIYWKCDSDESFTFAASYYASPTWLVVCEKNVEENNGTKWFEQYEYGSHGIYSYANITMDKSTSLGFPDTNRILRPILISDTEPDNAEIGDIWIKYST